MHRRGEEHPRRGEVQRRIGDADLTFASGKLALQAAGAMAECFRGAGDCTLIGRREKLDTLNAAFINSMSSAVLALITPRREIGLNSTSSCRPLAAVPLRWPVAELLAKPLPLLFTTAALLA